MRQRWRRLYLPSLLLLALLAITTLAGCGASASATTSTTSTTAPNTAGYLPPTPTNVPAGWQVYSGPHFTIAYPSGWSTQSDNPPTGSMGLTISLQKPQGREIVVQELYGYSDAQFKDMCKPLVGGTPVRLATLPMTYQLFEGVYRQWFFINSNRYSYMLEVLDGNQPQAAQAADDAVLATFRPDDPTPGCQSAT